MIFSATSGCTRALSEVRLSSGTPSRTAIRTAATISRLRVVTVGNGDTVEQLASRMAVVDRKLERFRILNGLEAGDHLNPGDLVKIVVE